MCDQSAQLSLHSVLFDIIAYKCDTTVHYCIATLLWCDITVAVVSLSCCIMLSHYFSIALKWFFGSSQCSVESLKCCICPYSAVLSITIHYCFIKYAVCHHRILLEYHSALSYQQSALMCLNIAQYCHHIVRQCYAKVLLCHHTLLSSHHSSVLSHNNHALYQQTALLWNHKAW